MNIDDELRFFRLTDTTIIKPFTSKDPDLNEFLFEKVKNYHKELLATTHIIENNEKTIAFLMIV
jgi:hypothetical protein